MGRRANIDQPRIYLGHESAALFWRAVHEGRLPIPSALPITDLGGTCATGRRALLGADLSPLGIELCRDGATASYHTEIRRRGDAAAGGGQPVAQLVPDGLTIPPGQLHPLQVLVGSQAKRWRWSGARAHLAAGRLPPGSFFAVSDDIAVSSPELTLVHLARSMRMLPCVELVCEWCGTYALGAGLLDCSFKRPPITDFTRLREFLEHPDAPRGSSGALGAMLLGAEGLASPRETECFLMLTLDAALGGFALPVPFANQQIPLVGTPYASLTGRLYYVADLIWPEAMLVVEYDGFGDHEAMLQQVANDKERRSVLAAMGYAVIVITKRELENLRAFERKVAQIALALGRDLSQPSPKEQQAREILFSWLFDAGHDHVPFGFGYR